ncbi:MAG TPA: hypothetical protein VHZ96_00655 [Frankiaceae bacterium]|nr:hypothetical protein [Frankiaceae bacterium]
MPAISGGTLEREMIDIAVVPPEPAVVGRGDEERIGMARHRKGDRGRLTTYPGYMCDVAAGQEVGQRLQIDERIDPKIDLVDAHGSTVQAGGEFAAGWN